ncbi:MAG: hypothetical protein MUC83_05975 [Pirellula sp.]|nr:hypothetical protein [Pirellula sp.]
MQFDKTAIIISQRRLLDLIDLSLIVLRSYFGVIVLCALIGIAPFALLNFVLTYPLWEYEYLAMRSADFSDPIAYRIRFYIIQMVLVFLQMPLALSGLTYFIGQAVFVEQQSIKQVFKSCFERWLQLAVVLGFFRFALLGYLQLLFMFYNPELNIGFELGICLFLICGSVFVTRAARPFAPEILVLERTNLLRKKSSNASPSYGQRNKWLHSMQFSDNFGAHLLLSFIAMWGVACLSVSLVLLAGVISKSWTWNEWVDLLGLPIACWIIAIWMTIVRFLLYMNTRIQTEGWEVELKFKAESERLAGAAGG